MTVKIRIAIAFVLIILATAIAGAQQSQTTQTAQTAASDREEDSASVREELRGVLNKYPPHVGRVLKLDPTLLQNQSYLATYPVLASFLAAHPEVTHTPAFFLEGIAGNDPTPETASSMVWRDMIEAAQIFGTFALFMGFMIWLVRTIIEHKRWSRQSKVQEEVHTKLLDRFNSNEDLLSYIQSPPGKRFLESAPIQLDIAARSVSAPIGRILWAVQVGVILAAGGVGLQLVSRSMGQVSSPIFALGVLAISIGAGFALSGFISFVLSRKFGLLQSATEPSDSVG